MGNTRIRAVLRFPASSTGADGVSVSSSSGTVTSRLAIPTLTTATIDAADYIPFYDSSVGAHRRGLVSDITSTSATQVVFNPRTLSANTSITSVNRNETLILSGSSMRTLTFAAATGYSSTHVNNIVNNSSRRWSVVVDGKTTQWLWPNQIMFIANTGAGGWTTSEVPLWLGPTGMGATYAAGNINWAVDPINGSDDNDGLATGVGGAVQHIQTAVNLATIHTLVGGNITCVAGTYRPRGSDGYVVHVTGASHGKPSNVLSIYGDTTGSTTTRQNFIIEAPVGGTAVDVQDYGALGITGFKYTAAGAGSTGCSARQLCILDLVDSWFDAFSGGTHIACTNGASIGILASTNTPIVINGKAAVHLAVSDNGFVNYNSYTVLIPSATSFTVFASCTNGKIGGGMSFSGAGAGSATIGIRYVVAENGIISGQETVQPFPGTVNGSTSSGGINL